MPQATAQRTTLLRVLGLFFGIAVSIGCTLGVGILRQPGPVASYLREPWLIMLMWFGGAVYSALGVLNVAELATMIPRAGGFRWAHRLHCTDGCLPPHVCGDVCPGARRNRLLWSEADEPGSTPPC